MKEEWSRVQPGDIVLWHPHADRKNYPVPALVVDAGAGGSLTLNCFPKLAREFTKTGVRHLDDPFHKTTQEVTLTSGGWEFSESMKRVILLEKQLHEIAEGLGMKDQPAAKKKQGAAA